MSIAPITLTSGATRGMSANEVEALKLELHNLYRNLHPRDASQPMSEIYAAVRNLTPDGQLAELAKLYGAIESVLGRYKEYAKEKESREIQYIKDARKVTHGALVAAATRYLNEQRLEGITITPERGAPLRIVRADVLLGTNEDPALPVSMVVSALDRACAEGGVELPAAVVAALPRHFALMRATMSTKPAVVKKQRM